MRFVIITGLSGAGKSNAVRIMEDMGYFVVDNMLPEMIPSFAEIAFSSQGKMNKIALVCDVRSGENFDKLTGALDGLNKSDYKYEILFLDAKDDVLIHRYKETRRQHPFSATSLLSDAILQERALLKSIKKRATHIIDTSGKTPSQLKKDIEAIFEHENAHAGLVINIISFGFKYGLPLDCDLVFDVRFLPNPFYIQKLKKMNGLQKEVRDFVFDHVQTQDFQKKMYDMIDYLLPYYEEEGKRQLVVGIGCTGGQHRSAAIAEGLHEHLTAEGKNVYVVHRERAKWPNEGNK